MASTTFPPQARQRSLSGVVIGAVVGLVGLLAVAVLLFGVLGYQQWSQTTSSAGTSSSAH